MHPTDAAAAAPGQMALRAWSADVFARRDVPPPDPVLAPVLARGTIALLTGPRGVGKSWLALAMADAAARGGTLAGWRARAACRVVYIDAAAGEALLQARLAALAPGNPSPNLILVPGDAQASGLPDVASEAGRAALDRLTVDADLVAIDGLTALVQLGRGAGSRWAALMGWLRALRRRGVAVLLVDAAEPRALAALADTVLRLERPVDGRAEEGVRCQLRVVASRAMAGPACERFELRMALGRKGAAWTRLDATDQRAIIAWRLHEGGYSMREIARKLEVSPATASRLARVGKTAPRHLRANADVPVEAPPPGTIAAEREKEELQEWARRHAPQRRQPVLLTLDELLAAPPEDDDETADSRETVKRPNPLAGGERCFSVCPPAAPTAAAASRRRPSAAPR